MKALLRPRRHGLLSRNACYSYICKCLSSVAIASGVFKLKLYVVHPCFETVRLGASLTVHSGGFTACAFRRTVSKRL